MKYDDFGRPIYETAEEYNRAKKTGGYSRTYESPEGDAYKHNPIREMNRNQTAAQRHATRQGSKKVKPILIGLAFFLILMIMVTVYSMFSIVGGIYEESYSDYDTWEYEEYEEYWGDASTPLPDGFETFVYDAQVFSLPMTFEEVLSMGFSVEVEYDETDLVPSGYSEFVDLVDSDGNIYAMISVDNNTEEEIPLGKCVVGYFNISNPYIYYDEYDAPTFSFGTSLNFYSSYEEIEVYLGEPYYSYSDHSEEDCYYDSYEWEYYGDNETHHVNITFWNGEISDVSIQKSIDEEIY